ncbi:MAG: tetratricopeptide repeat protein, partial [Candidatus Gastranaerophilaceae bacterium]
MIPENFEFGNDEIKNPTHIINTNADTQGDLANVAGKLYKNKEYDKALKLYTDMLLYTTDSDIYVRMGNCFEKLGKGKTAIEYWQKAIDINPMNPNGYINTANYYFNHNETEKAISFWIASLIPRPENSSTNYNLAVAYTVKKMPIEITTYYEKYIKE